MQSLIRDPQRLVRASFPTMTSDPTIHPSRPQMSVDAVQPPTLLPKRREDPAVQHIPISQTGTMQVPRSKLYHEMTSGQERISPAYFTKKNSHESDDDSESESNFEVNSVRLKGSKVREGRAYMQGEKGQHAFEKERPRYTRASDAARSQKPYLQTHGEAENGGSHVEVEGMLYARLREPSRSIDTNVERPKEARIAERRTYSNRELGLDRMSKEDHHSRTSAHTHPDNRQCTSSENNSGQTSHVDTVETHRAHQEQVYKPSQSLAHELQKMLQNYEQEKKDMIAITNAAIMKAERAERQSRDLKEQLERQMEELRTTASHLRQAEALREQTLELLEVKTSELRGAQAFMSKEDSLSGADVIGMVKSLNAEILQVSAFMADSLEDLGKSQREDTGVTYTESAVGLGEYITWALRSRPRGTDFDPMPVQIALQVCFVHACKRVMDGWVPKVPEYDSIFDAIYARIRDAEGQSISGRWRAMTRSQIRNIVGEDAHENIMEMISDEVLEVFRVAGYSTRDLRKHKYFDKFRERLDAIGRLTYRIQEAVGERLTSDEFCVTVIGIREYFDPDIMDDTFMQDGNAVTRERVAGTTDFGLSIQGSKKGSSPTILKKPKVVLVSAL